MCSNVNKKKGILWRDKVDRWILNLHVHQEKCHTHSSSNPYFFSIQTINMSVLVFSFSSWMFKWSSASNLHFTVLHRLWLIISPVVFFLVFVFLVFPVCPTCTKRSSKGTVFGCVPWDELYEDDTGPFISASLVRGCQSGQLVNRCHLPLKALSGASPTSCYSISSQDPRPPSPERLRPHCTPVPPWLPAGVLGSVKTP